MDNLVPYTSAYTKLGYVHQVDMKACGVQAGPWVEF